MRQTFLAEWAEVQKPVGVIHNWPAYVFRMTSLLEKLGVKNATYVHSDEVKDFCRRRKVW